MKKYSILSIVFLSLFFGACDDFLDKDPQGTLGEDELNNSTETQDALLTGVYASLKGTYYDNQTAARYQYFAGPTNWIFDVASDDAYKGGGGTSDLNDLHLLEIKTGLHASTSSSIQKWEVLYDGVTRANEAYRVLSESTLYDEDLKNTRIGEARFLRAHFYFELQKIFNLLG